MKSQGTLSLIVVVLLLLAEAHAFIAYKVITSNLSSAKPFFPLNFATPSRHMPTLLQKQELHFVLHIK